MLNPNSALRSLQLRTRGRGNEEGTMHRNATIDIQTAMYIQLLQSTGEGAPPMEEKQRMLAEIRNRSADASAHIDRHLLGHFERLLHGIRPPCSVSKIPLSDRLLWCCMEACAAL